MSKKRFHYTVILGVIHGRIILNKEPYALLSFLVDYPVTLEKYTVAREQCLNYLIQEFPELNTITVKEAFSELDTIQDSNPLCDALVIEQWLIRKSDLFLTHGEWIEVDKAKVNVKASRKMNNILYLHSALEKLGMN